MSVHVSIQIERTEPLSSGLKLVTELAKQLEELGVDYKLSHSAGGEWLEFQHKDVTPTLHLLETLADLLSNSGVSQIHWERNEVEDVTQPPTQIVNPETSISELGLDSRVQSALARHGGILTIGDLQATSFKQICSIHGIGRRGQGVIQDLDIELAPQPDLPHGADLREQELRYLPYLPVHLFHALRRSGITAIAQLINLSLDELMEIEGISNDSAIYIRRRLLIGYKLIPEDRDPRMILIEDLGLQPRAFNLLCRAEATTLQDLLDLGEGLRDINGMSELVQIEVREAVKKTGYELGS